MGSTVTRRARRRAAVTFAHVGDSRAYLWRGGVLTRLSDDHSLVAERVRAGALTPEEAAQHPQRSVITRALGADWQIDIDIWTTPARADDVILLCTDGLSGFVDDAAVARTLRAARALSTTRCAPWSRRRTRPAATTTSRPSRSASRPRTSGAPRPPDAAAAESADDAPTATLAGHRAARPSPRRSPPPEPTAVALAVPAPPAEQSPAPPSRPRAPRAGAAAQHGETLITVPAS